MKRRLYWIAVLALLLGSSFVAQSAHAYYFYAKSFNYWAPRSIDYNGLAEYQTGIEGRFYYDYHTVVNNGFACNFVALNSRFWLDTTLTTDGWYYTNSSDSNIEYWCNEVIHTPYGYDVEEFPRVLVGNDGSVAGSGGD